MFNEFRIIHVEVIQFMQAIGLRCQVLLCVLCQNLYSRIDMDYKRINLIKLLINERKNEEHVFNLCILIKVVIKKNQLKTAVFAKRVFLVLQAEDMLRTFTVK